VFLFWYLNHNLELLKIIITLHVECILNFDPSLEELYSGEAYDHCQVNNVTGASLLEPTHTSINHILSNLSLSYTYMLQTSRYILSVTQTWEKKVFSTCDWGGNGRNT
jgi:hypothetical protein